MTRSGFAWAGSQSNRHLYPSGISRLNFLPRPLCHQDSSDSVSWPCWWTYLFCCADDPVRCQIVYEPHQCAPILWVCWACLNATTTNPQLLTLWWSIRFLQPHASSVGFASCSYSWLVIYGKLKHVDKVVSSTDDDRSELAQSFTKWYYYIIKLPRSLLNTLFNFKPLSPVHWLTAGQTN